MSSTAMSFKTKIKNYAKQRNIPAQVVLQNVMFERFLERLSKSEYKDKFIIKGGMLISAVVGLDTRTTMDLDATLRKLELTEEKVFDAITDICNINLQDSVSFRIKSVDLIRKDDVYGGYRVKLDSIFEQIITPLSIDISTGDVITPDAIKYEISCIMDESLKISLWGYSIETVLAEKVETILSRNITTTRPRDYYDVYVLVKKQNYNKAQFHEALHATSDHRGSWDKIKDYEPILLQIENSKILNDLWNKYRNTFDYAKEITFADTIVSIRDLLNNESSS